MLLTEYKKGLFVDASTINWIDVRDGVKFTISGVNHETFSVDPDLQPGFISDIRSLSACLVVSRYCEMNQPVVANSVK